MEKIKNIIIIIVILISIMCVYKIGYKAYQKLLYSLEEVKNQKNIEELENIEKNLNSVKFPEKYNYKEMIYDSSNNLIEELDGYVNNEIQDDFNMKISALDTFSVLVDLVKNSQCEYKYEGTEKIDGKKFTKISFSTYSNKTVFYIDEELYYISKMEYYVKKEKETLMKNNVKLITTYFEKQQTYNYEYSFNIENKNDISKFNGENYPDYTYVEGYVEQ